jgi:hypothetical protein
MSGMRRLGACAAIDIPEFAYATNRPYGSGWKCSRGYRADGNTCIELELPANARVDYSGNGWDCNKRYRKRNGECVLP